MRTIIIGLIGIFLLTACGTPGPDLETFTPDPIHEVLTTEAGNPSSPSDFVPPPPLIDGMFTQLIQPLLRREYTCSIEEVRHSQQKEKRIIDTLEPLLGGHRLVIDPKVIEKDFQTAQKYPAEQQLHYMLCHQITRITSGRGSIRHDDRLDALAIACHYWVEQMAQDVNEKIQDRKEQLLQQELDKFKDTYYTRKSNNNQISWI